MNVAVTIVRRPAIRITSDSFWWLRDRPTFAGFVKKELIDGELLGVPLGDDGEPFSDASVVVKLQASDYRMLCDSGAFVGFGKTELIDGKVFELSPQYRRHGFIKDELAYRLRRALEELQSPLHVATEQSVAIALHTEPQPDIILTTEPRGDGPIPLGSVALIVEVADSTLAFDLNEKAAQYAAAGIAEYWVADVEGKVIHQLWAPKGDAYAQRREVVFGELIEAVTVVGLGLQAELGG